jgi:hypothetical protein
VQHQHFKTKCVSEFIFGGQRRCFISYRRQNAGDVRTITRALHHRGVVTWLDTDDLASEQTEDEIRRSITSDETGGAVLFITWETRGSPIILEVEIPELLARKRRDPNFYLVPVLGAGVTYGDVAGILGNRFGADDLARWNLMRPCEADAFLPEHARQVAKRVLALSLEQSRAGVPAAATYRLRLNSRRRPGFDVSALLSLNWSDRFPVHCADAETWKDELIPALSDVYEAVSQQLPNCRLVGDGLLGMPAAVALGRTFASPKQIRLDWAQSRSDREVTIWSLASDDREIGCAVSIESRDVLSRDLALLVSITDDARPAFDISSPALPTVRALIDVRLERFSHGLTGGQAGHIARKVVSVMRDARAKYRATGTVHLFIAGPVGLGVLIAEELNTFSSIATYEFCPSETVPYVAAAVLA